MILIQGGELFTPEPRGKGAVLVAHDRILRVGEVDRRALDGLGVPYEVVDASGCAVVPALIDPHEHLVGANGSEGFSSRSPELYATEIARAGIATVVGCLGEDTTMKPISALVGKVKALREEGINAYAWTGGYGVPPDTMLGSVREDILLVDEIIGTGEIAIADKRGLEPDARTLARLVSDTYVGGKLAGKCGRTHFHVGEGKERLKIIREVLDHHEVLPECIYATHVERTDELLDEAVDLVRRGGFVDVDTVEGGLAKALRRYLERGGDPAHFTASSDASTTSPENLFREVRAAVLEHGFALEQVLPIVTSNTASILKLPHKGRLAAGCVADVLVLGRTGLDIRHLFSKGESLIRDGALRFKERCLEKSNRALKLGDASA